MKLRYTEDYLVAARDGRTDSYAAWHDRIAAAQLTVAGEWGAEEPSILNLADKMTRDAARLASESKPSYLAPAYGDTKVALDSQRLRTVIGEGYFKHTNWDIQRPQLVMDFVVAGAGFVVYWPDPTRSVYPLSMRVDPYTCFPTIYNGELIDLLVVTEMQVRQAEAMYPTMGIARAVKKEEGSSDTVEVYGYYAGDQCVRAFGIMGVDGQLLSAQVVQAWEPMCDDRPPVAFSMLPSPDGAIRGLLDQVKGQLKAKDELVKDVLEVSAQSAFAPWEAYGIMNPDTKPGPDVIYNHDPSLEGRSFMRRVEPNTFSPQLPLVLSFLEDQTRAQLSYPATRQGEVPVSQGSGSFVAATQGDLTSMVREIQRGLADIQHQGARVMYALDENHLDYTKPLCRSIGRKNTYRPATDIDGRHELAVELGAGAGLDQQATDVRMLNYYSAGIVPGKRVLAETNFVDDPETWLNERQNEELERVALQRFAGDPTTSLDFLMTVLSKKRNEGLDFVEAYTETMDEMQSTNPAPQGGQPGVISPSQPDVSGAEEMAQGAPATAPVGGAPAIPGQFAPLPLQQVFVK
jgi:hypothetical protein